jgi:hypothetical protein|nr:MAG TPA: hypothetical protein [Caudoviricetes sp.]
MRNSIEEDMKILEEIIKGNEDCINAIYSQMKVKNDNDEDIQYYKKEIQSIKNIVNNYLKEKARADKLEKEYSAMLTESDENECDYKKLQEEFQQVDHECERLEEREEILNKYKLALFMVIRNSMVMPQGIKLGKTDKEINEMSYETMCSVLTMINYDQAEKFYKEGNGGK